MSKEKKITLTIIVIILLLLAVIVCEIFMLIKENKSTQDKNYHVKNNNEMNIQSEIVESKKESNKKVSITAEEIAKEPEKYYGKKVTNYTTGGLTYRIFFVDTENKYGDGKNTLYLKADAKDDIKLSEDISKLNDNDIEKFKNMNTLWREKRGELPIDQWNTNEKVSAWLCAPSVWKDFCDSEKANYVIGSPSVELYMASYNQVQHELSKKFTIGTEFLEKDEGYTYTLANTENQNIVNKDYITINAPLDYKEYGSMYAGSNGNKKGKWYLASPSCFFRLAMCTINGNTANLESELYNNRNTISICPIVSLKSGISVEIEN